jgi:hypothetical protein
MVEVRMQSEKRREAPTKRRRTGRFVLPALLGLLAVGLIWFVGRQERSLLEQAKRVGQVEAVKSLSHVDCPWRWQSNQEILVIRQSQAILWGGPGAPNSPLHACTLNVENGYETPQDRLSATLNEKLGNNGRMHLSGPILSPDGRWLLWDTPPFSMPSCFLATSTDGAHVAQWGKVAEAYDNELLWERDGSGFVRLRYNANGIGMGQAEFRSLGQSDPSQWQSSLTQIRMLPKNTVGGKALGWTTDGRVLLANWFTGNPDGAVYFSAIDVHNPNTPLRLYSHTPPTGMEVQSLALSPDGKRLAWMFGPRWMPRKKLDFLGRLRSWVGMQPAVNEELWVSNAEGTDMRRIGAYGAGTYDRNLQGRCAWSPDGRQLAFSFNHTLYTLPVR